MNLKCFDINIILAISTFPTVITIKTTRAVHRPPAHISKNYFSAALPSTITNGSLFATFFDMNIKHHILFFALSLWSRKTISPNRAK